MFRSYEPGRDGYVTLIANYQPLQDAYGGPNYFTLDPEALYEIHIDNDGDAQEDLTFRFRFDDRARAERQGLGRCRRAASETRGARWSTSARSRPTTRSALNVLETYTVQLVRGDRRGRASDVTDATDGEQRLRQADRLHRHQDVRRTTRPTPRAHLYDVDIPGCDGTGRVFVGQRKESFAVNLGAIFDLVNAPASVVVGGADARGRSLVPSTIADKNITTLALELPIDCLKGNGRRDRRAGPPPACARCASSTRARRSSCRRSRAAPGRRCRASATPLVNEVVIGLTDKDRFNGSQPKDDGQFATYVTNPSLPELLEVLFGSAGVVAPNAFPRADLVAAFLTGVPGRQRERLDRGDGAAQHRHPADAEGQQNSLGALGCFVHGVLTLTRDGCDPAGFPNGRRPGDDVVDIALRVVMGYLLPLADAPSGQLAFTDASLQEDAQFDAAFPYLLTPKPGAGG